MRSGSKFLILGFVAVFVLSMAIVPVFAATTAPQYASYSVSGSYGGHSFHAIVNESVASSSTAGKSDVTLSVASAMGNLSYSKIINASQVILPYFPTVANQSFTYEFHNYSITATINQAGSSSASFSGKSQTVSNYTFSVNVSGNRSMSATGSASVFPSGLVYAATVVANGTDTISIQLLSTNLSLTSQSGSSAQSTTSIAVAGSAASILIGVGAFVVYKRKNVSHPSNSEKPLYHVD